MLSILAHRPRAGGRTKVRHAAKKPPAKSLPLEGTGQTGLSCPCGAIHLQVDCRKTKTDEGGTSRALLPTVTP